MERRGMMCAVVVAGMLAGASAASADTVSLWFDANMEGGPVGSVVAFSAGAAGETDVRLLAGTFSSMGVGTLSWDPGFNVTRAMVVGVNSLPTQDHIVMFANESFASSTYGLKWSQVFTAPSPRHSELVASLRAAEGGDAGALAGLGTFLGGAQATAGQFDPDGAFSIIQFTVGTPGGPGIPEPASLGLLATGAAALMLRRKR